jgi:hypothetical protein
VANTFGEVLEKLYNYPDLFDVSSFQVFIR